MSGKFIIPALALAAFSSTSALAAEQVRRNGDGFTVRTGDLDLQTPHGRSALLRRVEEAGARLCRNIVPRIDRTDCANRAVDHAIGAAAPSARTALTAARVERSAPTFAGK